MWFRSQVYRNMELPGGHAAHLGAWSAMATGSHMTHREGQRPWVNAVTAEGPSSC